MIIERYGLSGYLAPDGKFYECGYQEHQDLASELIELYSLKNKSYEYNEMATEGEFLKFGTYPWSEKKGCNGCHVFKSHLHTLTEQQVSWLNENMVKATDRQRFELLISLEDHEKEKLTFFNSDTPISWKS